MIVSRLDHLVLTVKDIPHAIAFYTGILGMTEVTFGDGRKALTFGNQKINLHEKGREFEPKAKHPTPGSADLCFITEIPMKQILQHFKEKEVEIIEGPVSRTGAQGKLLSVYFRDPDGNLLEISNYEK